MTLNDIKKEICSLGFEREISTDESLVFATRRALACSYAERGVYGTAVLYQQLLAPDFTARDVLHTGSPITYSLGAGVYHVTVSGEGKAIIDDGERQEVVPFSAPYARLVGVRGVPYSITFEGDYCYTVSALMHFSTTDTRLEKLATEDRKEYSLRALFPDFLAGADTPRDGRGAPIEGAAVVSGTLSLPSSYVGEVRLRYRKAPPEVSLGGADAPLAIEPELECLIPMLAAAYYWLDDDPEKSQYYMSEYRNMMSALKLYSAQLIDDGYRDVTGWC